jgi:hypothetical protein
MRKNFPVDEEVHNSVVAHLSHVESKGGGLPSITSWVKAACLEKIARDTQKMERANG